MEIVYLFVFFLISTGLSIFKNIKAIDTFEIPENTTLSPDYSQIQDESEPVISGNIRFEMVGNTSHLFSEEDFKKVDVKLLREESNNNFETKQSSLDSIYDDKLIDNNKKTDSKDSLIYETDDSNATIPDLSKSLNDTSLNKTNKSKIECNFKNFTDQINIVQLVNGSTLSSILSESVVNDCFVVMFYVPWCPFSTRFAPNFNALPRAFEHLDILAFDVSKSTGYNTKFGTSAVPMIILFQQKNIIAKFNHTEKNLTDLIEFVSKHTGMNGNKSIIHLDLDFHGPVPTITVIKFDYALLFAWIFVIFFLINFLIKKFNLFHILYEFIVIFLCNNQHPHNE